jgi:alkyl hydroperoxide reductase subunit AhpF
MLDLIIIGGGAVGPAAAIYAARRRLNFKVISKNLGGEVALSGVVENWLGIKNTQGFELSQQFIAHMKSYDVPLDEGWEVTKIETLKKHHVVTAQNAVGETKTYETKAIIIGTGIHSRLLMVPGEEQFTHKGITYCTVCDGPLFRGKVTATIGAGNSALESALMMAGISKKVYVLSKYPNTKEKNYGFPPGENVLVEKLQAMPNVEILYESMTKEIQGDKKVERLVYLDKEGKENTIMVDGIMVHIGTIPNSNFIDHVEKNKIGEIVADTRCRTSVPGIFAAGDVSDIPYKQIGIAAGQGIVAALSAIEYINLWTE